METYARYSTRLRAAREQLSQENDVGNGMSAHGKRAMVRKAGGGAPKRALGDITNAVHADGNRKASKNGQKQRRSSKTSVSTLVTAAEPTPDALEPMQVQPQSIGKTIDVFADLELRNIVDIDKDAKNDPLSCNEHRYITRIYESYHERETIFMPRRNYMEDQPDISEKMRAILVDWLVDVHQKFKLLPETMYLTVNLIDRYLCRKSVSRQKLQLVGVTAMLIASKFYELYSPEINDFVYISDNAYTKVEIIKMEATLLGELEFDVIVPSARTFLHRFLQAAEAKKLESNYAMYCLELTLQEYCMLRYKPSTVAASACLVAGELLGSFGWTETLQHYTNYTLESLSDCASDLRRLISQEMEGTSKLRLNAVRRKYGHLRYMEVSKLGAPPSSN